MFGLFKRNKKEKENILLDLENNPLDLGDKVIALRYDIGEAELKKDDQGQWYYESMDSEKKVSWLKMIDASTERQKVKKIVTV